MSKLPEDIAVGLSVGNDNPVYKAVMIIVKSCQENEGAYAISKDLAGEARAWQCGRASVLAELVDVLEQNRLEALRQRGLSAEIN